MSERNWVFLPPSLRPVALALSVGVVALFLWQNAAVREPMVLPAPPAPQLKSASDAPLSQVNVSGPAAGLPAGADEQAESTALGLAPAPSSGPSFVRVRAKGGPIDEPAAAATGSGAAVSEEARSDRNAALFADLERQKKTLGISSLATPQENFPPQAEPQLPPVVTQSAPGLLADKKSVSIPAPDASAAEDLRSFGRPAPDAGLVATDAAGLSSSWVLLGFPNEPPAVDFSTRRAVLIKPSVSRILSVRTMGDAVIVLYRTNGPDEPSDPVKDRFALLPLQPGTVRIIDATPR